MINTTTLPTIADGERVLPSPALTEEMLTLVEHLAPHRCRLRSEEARRLLLTLRRRNAGGEALLLDLLSSPSGRVDLVAHLEYCSQHELVFALQGLLSDLLRVHEARRGYSRRRSLDPSRRVTPRRSVRARSRADRFRHARR